MADNFLKGLLGAAQDDQFRADLKNGLFDLGKGASRSAGQMVTGGVDLMSLLLSPLGYNHSAPVGSTAWAEQKGMIPKAEYTNRLAGLLGEGLGGVAPMVAQAKAPQIASGLLQASDNLMAPNALSKQSGMALFDTSGLPNRGRELIQSSAEELAKQLRDKGFQVEVQHSGSLAGPSSYLSVFDPQTGRGFSGVRFSGHSKGAFNNASVWNVGPEELGDVVSKAEAMRALGPSANWRQMEAINALDGLAAKVRPQTFSAFKEARDSGTDFTRYRAK